MPLSPLDIETRRFKRELYGYKKAEVDGFLRACADTLSQVNLEREELGRLKQASRHELSEYQKRERTLVEALAAAERIAENQKGLAQQEAERIIADARRHAEQLVEQTRDEMNRIERQIVRLKVERETFENRLNSLLEEHKRVLEIRRQELGVAEQLRARTTKPPQNPDND